MEWAFWKRILKERYFINAQFRAQQSYTKKLLK